MRSFCAAFILSLALAAGPALAQDAVSPESADPAVEPLPTREEQIDQALETLKSAESKAEARQAEQSVIRLWMASGSDTVDLLMDWSMRAMQEKRYPRALDFLDRVVVMRPDYVEGWNKRATVHFLMEDYGRSLDDIGHVLALEPRHFGALSGLGMILQSMEQTERATIALEQALAINPHLDDVREALEALKAQDEGEAL